MLGRSMFREMDEDPFFAGHTGPLRNIEDMFRSPFAGMLEHGRGNRGQERGRERATSDTAITPFGRDFEFGNMFESMNRLMKDGDQAFKTSMNDENGHSFYQSSFTSYRKDGEGPPKVYQASSSTKRGPGGIKETRKTLRDSERDLEKMGIGHHIQAKGHEVEREKNTRTGTTEERNNFHNMEESEASAFDREWQERTRHAFKGLDYSDRRGSDRRDEHRDIPRSRPLALEGVGRRDDRGGRRGEENGRHRDRK